LNRKPKSSFVKNILHMQNLPDNARIKFWNIAAHNFHQVVINYALPTSRLQTHIPKSVHPSVFYIKGKPHSILSFSVLSLNNFINGRGNIITGSGIDFAFYYTHVLDEFSKSSNLFMLGIQSNSIKYLMNSYLNQAPFYFGNLKKGNIIHGVKTNQIKISGKSVQMDFQLELTDIGENFDLAVYESFIEDTGLLYSPSPKKVLFKNCFSPGLGDMKYIARNYRLSKGVIDKINIEAFRNVGLLTKVEEHQPHSIIFITA